MYHHSVIRMYVDITALRVSVEGIRRGNETGYGTGNDRSSVTERLPTILIMIIIILQIVSSFYIKKAMKELQMI